VLQQRTCHRLAGAAVGPDVFHNIDVTYFRGTCKTPACSLTGDSGYTATLRDVVAGKVRGASSGSVPVSGRPGPR
jgi:type 1 fimbria pilin